MSDPIPHRIRPMEPADLNFVLETTLKVRQPRGLSWREWEGLRREETLRTIQGAAVLVVEADGVLLGYAIAAGGWLSMLYVKRDFRGDGLGLEMVRALVLSHDLGNDGDALWVEHPTASWRAWARRRDLKWTQVERKAAA